MSCDFCSSPIEFHHKDGLEVCKFHRNKLCEGLKYFFGEEWGLEKE